MRIVAFVLALFLAASVHAQESYAIIGAGAATDGPTVRAALGLARGPVTPTFRVSFSQGDADNPTGRDLPYRRTRAEIGVGLSRVQPISGPFRVEGHVGLAYALAGGDEEEDYDPFFDFPDLELGLTAPVEATGLLRLSNRLDLGLTLSHSFALAKMSSEEDPTLLLREPGLQQSGLTLGLRFH